MSEKKVSSPKEGAVQSLKAERVRTESSSGGRSGLTGKQLDFAAALG